MPTLLIRNNSSYILLQLICINIMNTQQWPFILDQMCCLKGTTGLGLFNSAPCSGVDSTSQMGGHHSSLIPPHPHPHLHPHTHTHTHTHKHINTDTCSHTYPTLTHTHTHTQRKTHTQPSQPKCHHLSTVFWYR